MTRLLRFSATGLAGFLVDAGLLVLLIGQAGLNPYLARIPSFLAAATLTWAINRNWTFGDRPLPHKGSQWARYLLVMVAGALINYGVYALLMAASSTVNHWPVLGVAVGSVAGLTVNYLGASLLVFPARAAADDRSRFVFRRLWDESLNRTTTLTTCAIIVPLACGLLSLFYGQDSNWDLRNYHLYNPYAWLHDRIGIDLAPAGTQSYFNPLLDIPYFLLIQHLPAPLLGFVFGWVHGLCFILVLGIVRRVLDDRPAGNRAILFLALAALASPVFLAELGGTMGNNLTALFVLGAVLMVVSNWSSLERYDTTSAMIVAGAGLVIGLGTGLKPTNAVYALSLCLAVLWMLPAALPARSALATMYGMGVLAGAGITAGFWHIRLWREFGNPLFPQFNAWFKSALASDTVIVDARWLPGGFREAVSWPFIMTLDPARVGDMPLAQLIWAILYLLFAGWGVAAVIGHARPGERVAGREGFLLAFIAFGFVFWMLLFSIHRYLAPLELLAPLAVWILCHRLFASHTARRAAAVLLVACVAYALVNWTTWGHRPWAVEAFRVEAPVLVSPARATFVLADREPMAWMIPHLPPDAVYISLGSFPESAAYRERAESIMARRDGSIIALVAGHHSRLEARIERVNGWLAARGARAGDRTCMWLRRLVERLSSVEFENGQPARTDAHCRFRAAAGLEMDPAAVNREAAARVAERLRGYGLQLDPSDCVAYRAYIGREPYPYLACEVHGPVIQVAD